MVRLAIPVYGLRPSPPETGRETILKGWSYPRFGDALAWVEAPSAAVAVRSVPVLPNRGNCTDASGTRTMVLVPGREKSETGSQTKSAFACAAPYAPALSGARDPGASCRADANGDVRCSRDYALVRL